MNSYSMGTDSQTEDHFFDTRNGELSASDTCSECSDVCLTSGAGDFALEYEFWTKKPESVYERRDKFLRWMGSSLDWGKTPSSKQDYSVHEATQRVNDRLTNNTEADPAYLDSKLQLFSSHYSFQSHDSAYLLEDGFVEEKPTWDNEMECGVDKPDEERTLTASNRVGPNKMVYVNDFWKTIGSSLLVQQLLQKGLNGLNLVNPTKTEKRNWLHQFSVMNHIVNRTKEFLRRPENNSKAESSTPRVHVNVRKKNSKELSSLCTGQEFPAHEGSIVAMKFSPDGQYLASAGVDGVVRVWKVLEDDIVNKFSSQSIDPSYLYFFLSRYNKLAPFKVDKEGAHRVKSLKKSSDSACVLPPLKAFQLSEKPLHEFHGHQGEVLALSWSKNGHLLSSSVDKTARLWRVGQDRCIGVYSHNNYVTSVEFNPVNDNHFISGSIDGKLRIWEIEGGRVIDWTDIREIVTAVCYCPNGKGGIVGSIDGHCRYYDVIDNRLQLGAEISLKGKKRSPGKMITGFQYCPGDASRVMVTTADSQVRILCGTNIVCKFKGNRGSTSRGAASFSSDGEHVVLATGDCNVDVWNYSKHDEKAGKTKKVWSCERFLSRNASLAIPWCGLKNKLGALPGSIIGNGHIDERVFQKFPDWLGYLLDGLHKGSPTWPEEKLSKLNPSHFKASLSKPEFKFLKNAWSNAFSCPHSWGLVIVTAGWDGCIRTFLNYGLPIRL